MKRKDKILQVFKRFQAARPNPNYIPVDKIYPTPFLSLAGVMLSAQSRDENTAAACQRLFAAARTPGELLALPDHKLRDLIRPAGLYNLKARNLKMMCRQLLERHGGKVPGTRAELMALHGVGRKSTDILMRFVFHEPAIAVDTHVHRLANRLGLARTKLEAQTADVLARDTPPRFKWTAHEWLVEHGKHVCRARNPRCAACRLADLCDYQQDRAKGKRRGKARAEA